MSWEISDSACILVVIRYVRATMAEVCALRVLSLLLYHTPSVGESKPIMAMVDSAHIYGLRQWLVVLVYPL